MEWNSHFPPWNQNRVRWNTKFKIASSFRLFLELTGGKALVLQNPSANSVLIMGYDCFSSNRRVIFFIFVDRYIFSNVQ